MAARTESAVSIGIDRGAAISGDLVVPGLPAGVVVFAHGSGSSRHSSRNRAVASSLNAKGLATLLVDLLTAEEERIDLRTRHLRFDVELLAGRLAAAARWTAGQPVLAGLSTGYFGASTGAAAALIAAAREPDSVGAVVSRGGRPDLAGDSLPGVRAPTLLLVGSRDEVVLELNRQALARLSAPAELVVVPGATHLFEEPGALERVAEAAGDWFGKHLGTRAKG